MRSVECRENPRDLSYRANGTNHCQNTTNRNGRRAPPATRPSDESGLLKVLRRREPSSGSSSFETRRVPKAPIPSTTTHLMLALVAVRASRAGTADALRRDAITFITGDSPLGKENLRSSAPH